MLLKVPFNYNNFIKELEKMSDLKYLEFNKSLLNDDIKLIGVRTPILKRIAKEISKENYLSFIKQNKHEYYEEIVVHGLVIGYLKLPFEEILKLLDEFLLFNCNWATNDLTVSNLKIFKTNKKLGFNYILKLLKGKSFDKRFGIVLLLNYYIDDDYIHKIFDLIPKIKDDNYYVGMSLAWLISIMYIKYPNETLNFLNKKLLDKWTFNKSIQKIRESNRVDSKTKEELKKLKIV